MTYNKTPLVATAAGATLLATSASLNISAATDGGAPIMSPAVFAIAIVALGTTIAVPSIMFACREGRRGLAVVAILFLLCGEAFNAINSAERLLTARDDRAQATVVANRHYTSAEERVEMAVEAYQEAENVAAAEARRGGCRRICRDLQAAAEIARRRLEDARAEAERAPARHSEHILSDTIGWQPSSVELVQAGLFTVALNGLGFMLLAIGNGGSKRVQARHKSVGARSRKLQCRRRKKAVQTAAIEPPRKFEATRLERVQDFVESFRSQQGRDPRFIEVQRALDLPKGTASTYRKVALSRLKSESGLSALLS